MSTRYISALEYVKGQFIYFEVFILGRWSYELVWSGRSLSVPFGTPSASHRPCLVSTVTFWGTINTSFSLFHHPGICRLNKAAAVSF